VAVRALATLETCVMQVCVLQCVAVCCSVLQRVAVCSSVLQWLSDHSLETCVGADFEGRSRWGCST